MTRRVLGWLLAGALVAGPGGTAAAAAASQDRSQGQRQEDGRRRHKWWQDERLRAELGLTDQQAQDVEQIFQTTVPRLRTLKDQLDQLERDLSKMIGERTAQESTVAQAIDRVERTRGELNKQRQLMLYRMHRILSAEQNAKLRAISEREHPDKKENHQR
ncbi:MAG: Spy/CpxP family protein refolding chaperone [Vicinamibacterales bacterium]